MNKVVYLLCCICLGAASCSDKDNQQSSSADVDHLYATWDTMEFDKCVSVWLIVHYIDAKAKFEFHPHGTEIEKGIVFDVPGAKWSRVHLKCTSDCIWEEINKNDPAAKKIVEMAHIIELNFWQLDSFPQAKESFNEFQTINQTAFDKSECLQKMQSYLDALYKKIQKENIN